MRSACAIVLGLVSRRPPGHTCALMTAMQSTANPNIDVGIDVSGNNTFSTVGDTANDNDTNTATATGESADVAVQDECV